MARTVLMALIALALTACDDSSGGAGGTGGSGIDAALSHTFAPVMIESGAEIRNLCQSWTLNNEEPLYISKIRQTNDGAWHHSNWFFVPEDVYEGPDGTWNCNDRGFNQVSATVEGGVFFAQSTQTFEEIQAFQEGAVIEVPPRHKVVGNIHLVNVSANALDTSLSFGVETVLEEEVQILLRPIAFTNEALDIEPEAESRFGMTCNLGDAFQRELGTPANYNVYYVLAHYHEWGNYFRLSFVDGEGGDRTIYELSGSVGEPLGAIIDPPISSEGAANLRVECGYLNDTTRRLKYGFAGEEMCVFLAYSDANLNIGGISSVNTAMGPNEDGVFMNETACAGVIALPPE